MKGARMRDHGKIKRAHWLSGVAVAIAGVMLPWQMFAEDAWFGMAFGALSLVFWTLAVIWFVSVAYLLGWARRWWILITAPVVLFPIAMACTVLIQCARGNCF